MLDSRQETSVPPEALRTVAMITGLSDFIVANTARIVDECEAFARTLGPAAEDMDREALRDHVSEVLVAIASDMKVPQTEWERSEKSKGQSGRSPGAPHAAAETHGALRAASGFDVAQTASEYRALRASVIKLWLRTSPTLGPPHLEELIRFNEAMDQALAETLLQFAAASEQSRNLFLGVLSHELRTPPGDDRRLGSIVALPGRPGSDVKGRCKPDTARRSKNTKHSRRPARLRPQRC